MTKSCEFEVFDSGGSWAFLLGKPLLRSFRAKQAYWPDTVSIRDNNNKKEMLANEIKKPRAGGDRPGMNLTLDVKQCDIIAGGSPETDPPSREVLLNNFNDSTKAHTDKATLPVNVLSINNSEINTDLESVLTRESDLHKPEHVRELYRK